MQLISLTFALFLLMDALGNVPLFIAFLKGIPRKKQKKIIVRELLIALGVIILFYFLGDLLLELLNVEKAALLIAGGIILFLIAIGMVFPDMHKKDKPLATQQEPFLVPLAIPFIAGPAVLAAVMLYSHEAFSPWVVITAILIAWGASLLILLSSSYLTDKLGEKGLIACERLMGFLLVLISVQMFLTGIHLFTQR